MTNLELISLQGEMQKAIQIDKSNFPAIGGTNIHNKYKVPL